MAGLVPAIHVQACRNKKDMDARDKPGHDGKLVARPLGVVESLERLFELRRDRDVEPLASRQA